MKNFIPILISIFLLKSTAVFADEAEYKMSSGKDWVVVNDHVVMKVKNTLEIQILNNDRLPPKYKVQITGFTSQTKFKNDPALIGQNKLKFHQPQVTGVDTVRYEVCDDEGQCLQALAIFRVVNNEDQPNAARDVLITDQNKAVEADVFQNDFGNNSVKLTVVKEPISGKYQTNGTKIKYTPESSFQGVDSLTYQICDGKCSQNQMVIYVLGKNSPPVLSDIILKIKEDETFDFSKSNFTSSYKDPGNISLNKIKLVQLPTHGSLIYLNAKLSLLQEINEANLDKIKYVPNADYFGDDYWLWNGSNGILYSEKVARIQFEIQPVNDPPQANDDIFSLDEDMAGIIDVLANDSDVDGDILTIVKVEYSEEVGVLVIENKKISYTPTQNFNGSFSFSYTISDGTVNSSAKVSVTVNPVNDLPTISDFQVDLDENSQLIFNEDFFNNNFSDPDNTKLQKIKIYNLPADGRFLLFDQPVSANQEVFSNDLDNLKYVPDKGFTGQEVIEWNATDGIDYAVSAAQLTINVNDINFPPEANNDNVKTLEDIPVEIDVLANDNDDDGDDLTIQSLPSISNGIIEITSNKKILFTPAENYYGSFSFQYEIADEAGATDQATVNVIVEEVNDPPSVDNFDIEILQNTAYNFTVQKFLDHYQDVETDEFNSIIITMLPANGLLKLRDVPVVSGQSISPFALADLDYEPNENFLGNDVFAWNASDGDLLAPEEAIVEISVRRIAGQIHAFKAISPNGDGKNDEWIIEGIELFPENVLSLYDRSGNKIISISGYDNQQKVWRGERNQLGTFNLVADGTYYYNLELGDGINSIKGYVIVQK